VSEKKAKGEEVAKVRGLDMANVHPAGYADPPPTTTPPTTNEPPRSKPEPLAAARGLVNSPAEAKPAIVEPERELSKRPCRCDGPWGPGPWHAARCGWWAATGDENAGPPDEAA